jgi:hypothetical protein
MDTYNFIATLSTVFSDAPDDTVYEIKPYQLQHGVVQVSITTTDPNLTSDFGEQITQADASVNRAGLAAIVMTVTTTDKYPKIVSSPMVTNDNVKVTVDCVETDDANTGKHTAIITAIITYLNDYDSHVYVETKIDNATVIPAPPKVIYRYLIMRHNLIDGYLHGQAGQDPNMLVTDMFSFMNMTLVKMSQTMYDTLSPGWVQEEIIEVDEDTAKNGVQFWGEIRDVAKVFEAKNSWYGEKVPHVITPEEKAQALNLMKMFATEIIEHEFDRRFLAMRGAGMMEVESWEVQKYEARAFKDDPTATTPFLDYLSTSRGKDKTELANKIIQKAADYELKLSRLLVEMQTVIDKFNSAASIWDINILYEDYMGIQMPIKSAIALGRTVSDTDWNRKPEWQVKGNGYYF